MAVQKKISKAPRAFSTMCKPIGSVCNLNCTYCYYLEKMAYYPNKTNYRMDDATLEAFIKSYITSQDVPQVDFVWQGGEPSLAGINFFKKALALEQKYANGKTITNAFQTNGTLLNEEWASFLASNNFLVGISIDGPEDIHNTYRKTRAGHNSFTNVIDTIHLLKRFGVEFNTLTVVGRHNVDRALEVYEFLKDIGSGFIQFIPLVERPVEVKDSSLRLASAPNLFTGEIGGDKVTEWSVEPEKYGDFLCTIYDRWVRNDVGKVFVQIFDVALCAWAGVPAPLCVFRDKCGQAVVIEHNGDLYSCDHFVYPEYKVGNILTDDLATIIDSKRQKKFGDLKAEFLPKECRKCGVHFVCHGECPKHRFLKSKSGEPGLNYLCVGYKKFFTHISKTMSMMKQLLDQERAPAEIVDILKKEES